MEWVEVKDGSPWKWRSFEEETMINLNRSLTDVVNLEGNCLRLVSGQQHQLRVNLNVKDSFRKWVTRREQKVCVALKGSLHKQMHRFLTGCPVPPTSAHFQNICRLGDAVICGQVICKVVLCLPFICLRRIVLWVRFARILFSPAMNLASSLLLSSFRGFIKMF